MIEAEVNYNLNVCKKLNDGISEKEKKNFEIDFDPFKNLCLSTRRPFKQDELVIEYTGEELSSTQAKKKEKFYENFNLEGDYMFWFNVGSRMKVIDARYSACAAKFINHSKEPNLIAKVKDKKLFFYAARDILSFEELTIDYKEDRKSIIKEHQWLK